MHVADRLAVGCAEAGVHPAGLEGTGVGAGADLAPGILAGEPHLQIVGAGGAEPGVAGAQQHAAVGQPQPFQQASAQEVMRSSSASL